MSEKIEDCQLLKQGAEGRIYISKFLEIPCIIKERFEKKYRHPLLDKQLTKERIRAESKAIARCRSLGIRTPALYAVNQEKRTIHMEFIKPSITAKEFIYNANDELIHKLSQDIGKNLAIMHSNNIVHGDLTTSNILVINSSNSDDFYANYDELEIAVIDFGLAQLEANSEAKAVDLYVLERALISTHSIADQIFPNILDVYKKEYNNCQSVIKKLEEVRARGRKRTMVG